VEITIKSLRIIKEGTQAKSGQPYKWVSVMADDGSEKGTEYTTFDAGVLKLGPGSVIDIGDPVIKGGKLSFKELVSLVSEGQASEAPVPGPSESSGAGAYKRDTEAIRLEYGLKAHLQAIERASIEAQTAYNGIMRLSSIPGIELTDDSAAAYEEAIAWARAKMAATLANQGPSETTGAKSDTGKAAAPGEAPAPAAEGTPTALSFPHLGALLQWCATKGIDRKGFMKLVGATEATLPHVDIEAAFQAVTDHLREYGHLEEEIFGKAQ